MACNRLAGLAVRQLRALVRPIFSVPKGPGNICCGFVEGLGHLLQIQHTDFRSFEGRRTPNAPLGPSVLVDGVSLADDHKADALHVRQLCSLADFAMVRLAGFGPSLVCTLNLPCHDAAHMMTAVHAGGQGPSVVTEGTASEDKSEQTDDVALRRVEQSADSGDISLADTAQQPREPAALQPQHTAGGDLALTTPLAEDTATAEPAAGVTAVTAAAAPAAGGPPAAPQPLPQPQPQQLRPTMASRFCPPHGAKAICGRRARMEDAYTAVPFLLEVPMPGEGLSLEELVPPRIATHVKSASGSDGSQDSDGESDAPSASAPSSSSAGGGVGGGGGIAPLARSPPAMDALHFFGVFDGHGGAEAALHCARTLHERIAEALATRFDLP